MAAIVVARQEAGRQSCAQGYARRTMPYELTELDVDQPQLARRYFLDDYPLSGCFAYLQTMMQVLSFVPPEELSRLSLHMVSSLCFPYEVLWAAPPSGIRRQDFF